MRKIEGKEDVLIFGCNREPKNTIAFTLLIVGYARIFAIFRALKKKRGSYRMVPVRS